MVIYYMSVVCHSKNEVICDFRLEITLPITGSNNSALNVKEIRFSQEAFCEHVSL